MADEVWLTIDELAHATGVTVRQVRSHQARGLIPPPDVRARTGYYGPEHRARLELVIELQAEGVKLDTVKKLLETTGGQATEVSGWVPRTSRTTSTASAAAFATSSLVRGSRARALTSGSA